jgi:hypothetical protein
MLMTRTVALRRFGPPPSEHLSSSGLGYSNPRYSHPLGLSCCRFVLECGDDSKQQEEGSQSKGSWKEKGINVSVGTVSWRKSCRLPLLTKVFASRFGL